MRNESQRYQESPFLLKGNKDVGVLLIHGWSSVPGEFLPLAKYLHSFGWTVYAPLLKGHGTRPEDLENVIWQDWLEDSKQALVEIKKHAAKVFVGGVSMGGNLAMLLSEEPGVEGILSLGTPIKFRFHRLGKAALFLMGLTKKYRRKYYPKWVRRKMGKRVSYPYYPIASAKEVVKLTELTRKNLNQITKSILIMQSSADHMASKKSPDIIYQNVKSKIKEIVWLEDVYHVFIAVDGKEKVFEKISEFVNRIKNN